MGQQDRAMKQHLDLFLAEQRRLHKEVMDAVVDTKVAAATANGAADRIEKSSADLTKWTLSVQRRVEKLERWQAGLIGAGILAGAAFGEKVKKLFGLGA